MTEPNPLNRRSPVQLDKGEINIKYVIIGLVAIIGYVGWFYSTVIIPLSNIQVTMIQIQVTLKAQAMNYVALQAQVTQNSNDILIIKEELQQMGSATKP